MPFAIGEAERDRWMELMKAAMSEADVPAAAAPTITAFFGQMAEMMRNR